MTDERLREILQIPEKGAETLRNIALLDRGRTIATEAAAPGLKRLVGLQWSGYSTEDSERACPVCGAWRFQPSREQPIHAFACGLATFIGAPMETREGMARGEYWGGDSDDNQ